MKKIKTYKSADSRSKCTTLENYKDGSYSHTYFWVHSVKSATYKTRKIDENLFVISVNAQTSSGETVEVKILSNSPVTLNEETI